MERPPEQIRGEIDDVREDLGEALEAIGDRVAPEKVMGRAKAAAAERVEDAKQKLSPGRLARRGAGAVRQGVRRVVGGGDDNGSGGRIAEPAGSSQGRGRPATGATHSGARAVARRARGAGSSVADSIGDAPGAVRQSAEGNPLAAGLLAFAGGFFAAALLPPTERERQLTQKAKETLQPLAESAVEAGKGMAEELQSTAKARLQETVKDAATDVAKEVMGRAQSGAGRVREEASDATDTVARRAKKATTKVQRQPKGATRAVRGTTKKTLKKVTGGAKKAGSSSKRTPPVSSAGAGSGSRVAATPGRQR